MVQFKFIVLFSRVVGFKLAIPSAKNPEFFTDGQIMSFENGIVKYPTPMVNWNDFQNCSRIMLSEIVSTFGDCRQYLDKIAVVAYDFIVHRSFFGITKSKVKTAFTYWLEQHNFIDTSFGACAFKKIALPVFGGFDVISLPQHLRPFLFCRGKIVQCHEL